MYVPVDSRKKRYKIKSKNSFQQLFEDFSVLSGRILRSANQGIPRVEFMAEVSRLLLEFSGCDAVEMRLEKHSKLFICELKQEEEQRCSFEVANFKPGRTIVGHDAKKEITSDELCAIVMWRKLNYNQPHVTKQGSLWTGNADRPVQLRLEDNNEQISLSKCMGDEYKSLALLPFTVDGAKVGLLILKSAMSNHFASDEIGFYEVVAQTVGLAVSDRKAQSALRERVKELTCLYQIAQLVEQSTTSFDGTLQGIVAVLRPAWLYPEIAEARIFLDKKTYETPNFQEKRHTIMADIIIDKIKRGYVQVVYLEEKIEMDEGPFLTEERNLINEVARQIAQMAQKREAENEKQKLQEQLRHADRLATIGQLATGVAHELNEPLGGILGFAQLALQDAKLSDQTQQDLKKIENASLHAREIIKKLMYFARQIAPSSTKVDLNLVVEEGLSLLESRCAKSGIELITELSSDMPEIVGDRFQLHQVLINLAVNAIQAMDRGGMLTICTRANEKDVFLEVEDNGIGMNENVVSQIFLPFFTTKDVDQGTGLGLAVVHGIVTSHKGSIRVESAPGKGSRFEIQLPIEPKTDGEASQSGSE